TGFDVRGSEATPASATPAPDRVGTAVIILADPDEEGQLGRQLATWDFRATKAALLLFHALGREVPDGGTAGPAIAVAVRDMLGGDGLVVTARAPVSPEESLSLARAVLDGAGRGVTVLQSVM